MFSQITNSFTEGIKRLSLDALQDEEIAKTEAAPGGRTNHDGDSPPPPASESKTFRMLASISEDHAVAGPANTDGDEWDWDEDRAGKVPRRAGQTRKESREQVSWRTNSAQVKHQHAGSVDSVSTSASEKCVSPVKQVETRETDGNGGSMEGENGVVHIPERLPSTSDKELVLEEVEGAATSDRDVGRTTGAEESAADPAVSPEETLFNQAEYQNPSPVPLFQTAPLRYLTHDKACTSWSRSMCPLR